MKLNFNFSDVCQFSHSEEECKVWNYMKENNSKFFVLKSYKNHNFSKIFETAVFEAGQVTI